MTGKSRKQIRKMSTINNHLPVSDRVAAAAAAFCRLLQAIFPNFG